MSQTPDEIRVSVDTFLRLLWSYTFTTVPNHEVFLHKKSWRITVCVMWHLIFLLLSGTNILRISYVFGKEFWSSWRISLTNVSSGSSICIVTSSFTTLIGLPFTPSVWDGSCIIEWLFSNISSVQLRRNIIGSFFYSWHRRLSFAFLDVLTPLLH